MKEDVEEKRKEGEKEWETLICFFFRLPVDRRNDFKMKGKTALVLQFL